MSRSSMFFVSDVRSAAETMAYALEEHGLPDVLVDLLADELEECATAFFARASEARAMEGEQTRAS